VNSARFHSARGTQAEKDGKQRERGREREEGERGEKRRERKGPLLRRLLEIINADSLSRDRAQREIFKATAP